MTVTERPAGPGARRFLRADDGGAAPAPDSPGADLDPSAAEVVAGVESMLAACSDLVAAAADRYLPRREPDRYLYELVRQYPQRRGKGIRTAICLAACTAFGGRVEEALPTAASLELVHNAFLIHDDIEDESETRRGAPTLHRLYGLPLALNAGDAMTALSMRPLTDNLDLLGPGRAWRVLEEFHQMMEQTVEGQALELGWRDENAVDLVPDDYLELVLKKTCWYTTIYPLRAGAIIAGRQRTDLHVLNRLGFSLGTVFQIADDLQNLAGAGIAADGARPDGVYPESVDPDYGKESCGDVFEGKRTVMLIHLLHHAPPADRVGVVDLLGRPRVERSWAEVRHVVGLMHEHGSIDYARRYVAEMAELAVDDLHEAFAGVPPSEGQTFLYQLVPYLTMKALQARI